MKTLLLTVEYPSRASYYDDWKDALLGSRHFDVTVANLFTRDGRRQVQRTAGDYELIIALHACTADSLLYVEPVASALQARHGRLICFIGNELNLPWAPLGDKIAWLKRVAPDIVATQLLAEAGEWLYAPLKTRVLALPHALNPKAFLPRLPTAQRPIDIGARSYRYLAYLGDDDRNQIYDFFAANRFAPPFLLDFSTEHRFNRGGWAEFLNRCKATISTEAGSWYLERDDATVRAIRDHVASKESGFVVRADSPLRRVAHRLPYPVKTILRRLLRSGAVRHEAISAETLDFHEIYVRFFASCPKPPVYAKCISSRHFDAIGTKTLQIMFPGRYNDILTAGEHYVALQPDFSDADRVAETFRDASACQRIVDRAYDHAMASHTYDHRLDTLLMALR